MWPGQNGSSSNNNNDKESKVVLCALHGAPASQPKHKHTQKNKIYLGLVRSARRNGKKKEARRRKKNFGPARKWWRIGQECVREKLPINDWSHLAGWKTFPCLKKARESSFILSYILEHIRYLFLSGIGGENRRSKQTVFSFNIAHDIFLKTNCMIRNILRMLVVEQLAERLTILERQHSLFWAFCEVQKRRSTDVEALKLQNVRLGVEPDVHGLVLNHTIMKKIPNAYMHIFSRYIRFMAYSICLRSDS